jgi:signal peptidase I
MRWFWFISLSVLVGILAIVFAQPLILISLLVLVDMLLTRKINWFFWIPERFKAIPNWINLIIWVIFNVFFLRFFVFDSMTVLNPGMRPVIMNGDNILISKIHYGPRLPITPVNIPLTHHYLPLTRCTPSYWKAVTLPAYRLKGLTTINRGDLLAYNFPEGDSAICGVELINYYALSRKKEAEGDTVSKAFLQYRPIDRREPEISRCIGIPGDTITLTESLLTNGNYRDQVKARISLDYLVEVENRQIPGDVFGRLELNQSEVQILPGLGYLIPLLPEQVIEVRQRPEVKAMTKNLIEPGQGDFNIFPHQPEFQWNRDNFGPVIVPRKGDIIKITPVNLPFYRRIIEVYEKNEITFKEDSVLINGWPSSTYVFKQNYYFVMGDNRHHSRDSRHWGFLPEDHIIGKPLLIWFSAMKSPGKNLSVHWNRILKFPS